MVRKKVIAAACALVALVVLLSSVSSSRDRGAVPDKRRWLCIGCGERFEASAPSAASDLEVLERRVGTRCPACGKAAGRLYSVLNCRHCGHTWHFPHLLPTDPETARAPLACPKCKSTEYQMTEPEKSGGE